MLRLLGRFIRASGTSERKPFERRTALLLMRVDEARRECASIFRCRSRLKRYSSTNRTWKMMIKPDLISENLISLSQQATLSLCKTHETTHRVPAPRLRPAEPVELSLSGKRELGDTPWSLPVGIPSPLIPISVLLPPPRHPGVPTSIRREPGRVEESTNARRLVGW